MGVVSDPAKFNRIGMSFLETSSDPSYPNHLQAIAISSVWVDNVLLSYLHPKTYQSFADLVYQEDEIIFNGSIDLPPAMKAIYTELAQFGRKYPRS